jgi:competence protein ComEA
MAPLYVPANQGEHMKKLAALLAATLIGLTTAAIAKDEKKPATPVAAPAAAEKKAPELMDINAATEKELATLKGVGEARAKAIVKGRPYKGKNELLDKKIVPENVYNDIKDLIIAKQPEKKEEPKKEAKKDEKKK